MIVVISDVHLGYEKCNKEAFESFVEEFLEKEKIEHLILLGDILDFWRRFSEGVILENLEILNKLNNLNTEKHYVIGNHDYSLYNLTKYKDLQFKFTKDLSLQSDDKKFRFIHGYQIEFENVLPLYEGVCEQLCKSGDEQGKMLSDLWSWYERNLKRNKWISKITGVFKKKEAQMYDERWGNMETLDKEKLNEMIEFVQKSPKDREMSPLHRKEVWRAEREIAQRLESVKLMSEEVLVYGHTHKPFCKKDKANTGSWVSDAEKTNSYLIIDNGKMELKYWK